MINPKSRPQTGDTLRQLAYRMYREYTQQEDSPATRIAFVCALTHGAESEEVRWLRVAALSAHPDTVRLDWLLLDALPDAIDGVELWDEAFKGIDHDPDDAECDRLYLAAARAAIDGARKGQDNR